MPKVLELTSGVASSPIIHPAVQQMEDDAEMLLPPSSPLGPDAPVPSPARLSRPVSNISHASTAPQRVDDSVLKRSRDDSDSDSGGSGVHESKRARGEGKEGAGE